MYSCLKICLETIHNRQLPITTTTIVTILNLLPLLLKLSQVNQRIVEDANPLLELLPTSSSALQMIMTTMGMRSTMTSSTVTMMTRMTTMMRITIRPRLCLTRPNIISLLRVQISGIVSLAKITCFQTNLITIIMTMLKIMETQSS